MTTYSAACLFYYKSVKTNGNLEHIREYKQNMSVHMLAHPVKVVLCLTCHSRQSATEPGPADGTEVWRSEGTHRWNSTSLQTEQGMMTNTSTLTSSTTIYAPRSFAFVLYSL